jgi:hypothetical protein
LIVPDCEARLRELGLKYRLTSLAPVKGPGGGYTCGNEQAVVYLKSPARIAYNSAPVVSCPLALALVKFERMAQAEAIERFGSPIARIEQAGTYNCRKMARFGDLVSEHSFANAIDVRAFVLKNGKRISVLRDFGALDSEPGPKGQFLRELARRLYDDDVFSVVLTPYWDALHRDHLHFDMAPYRADGTR